MFVEANFSSNFSLWKQRCNAYSRDILHQMKFLDILYNIIQLLSGLKIKLFNPELLRCWERYTLKLSLCLVSQMFRLDLAFLFTYQVLPEDLSKCYFIYIPKCRITARSSLASVSLHTQSSS